MNRCSLIWLARCVVVLASALMVGFVVAQEAADSATKTPVRAPITAVMVAEVPLARSDQHQEVQLPPAIVAASESQLLVYDIDSLQLQRTVESKLEKIHDLALSPDGSLLAVAGGSPADVGAIELRQCPSLRLIHEVRVGTDVAITARWSADGSQLIAPLADGKLAIVSREGKLLHSIDAHNGAALAADWIAASGADAAPTLQIVSAGRDQSIKLWDAATAKQHRTLDQHTGEVRALVLLKNDRKPAENQPARPAEVASISADKTVRLWQPTIGRLVRFVKLSSSPLAICQLGTSDRVAIGCDDGSVAVVDLRTAKIVATHSAIKGPIFALGEISGSKMIVAGSSGALKVLDLSSPKD